MIQRGGSPLPCFAAEIARTVLPIQPLPDEAPRALGRETIDTVGRQRIGMRHAILARGGLREPQRRCGKFISQQPYSQAERYTPGRCQRWDGVGESPIEGTRRRAIRARPESPCGRSRAQRQCANAGCASFSPIFFSFQFLVNVKSYDGCIGLAMVLRTSLCILLFTAAQRIRCVYPTTHRCNARQHRGLAQSSG
jgi:hypothetical protein